MEKRYIYEAEEVAAYLIHLARKEEKTLTLLQVMKLVYLCHGWMLGIYKRPLITEDIEAWKYGPVIFSLYLELKRYRHAPVESSRGEASIFIHDVPAKSISDQVYRLYGKLSGLELSALTHQEGTPWQETWDAIGKHTKHAIIPQNEIQAHFEKLASQG